MSDIIKAKIDTLMKQTDINTKVISSDFIGTINIFELDEDNNVDGIHGAIFKLIYQDDKKHINIFRCDILENCLIPSHRHNNCKEILIITKGSLTRIETHQILNMGEMYIHDVGDVHTYYAEKGTEFYCMFIPAIDVVQKG